MLRTWSWECLRKFKVPIMRSEEHEAEGWFPAALLPHCRQTAQWQRQSQETPIEVRPVLDHTMSGNRRLPVPLRKQAGLFEFDSFCYVFHAKEASLVSGSLCGVHCTSQGLRASLLHSSSYEQKSSPLLLRLMQVKPVP